MNPLHDATILANRIREQFGDDEQLIADTIEGQTSALEIVSRILRRIAETGLSVQALKLYEAEVADRRKRMERHIETLRDTLQDFMQDAGLKTLERPEATVSVVAGGQSVVYAADLDATKLPKKYQRTKVEADKAAIRADVLAGKKVPGATLGNSPPTLKILRS